MSYNIHGGAGEWRKFDPEAVLEVIEAAEADVVGLQEVADDTRAERRLLHELEADRSYRVHYGPTLHEPGGRYGNLLLSRWPVDFTKQLDLTVGRREPRSAIRALVRHPRIRLDITVTHLGLRPGERRRQVRRLVEDHRNRSNANGAEVHALMGDFNEWWLGARLHRQLHRNFGRAPLRATFPARFPLFPLDRILVRAPGRAVRWRVLKSQLAARASDHLPLIAEIGDAP